MFIHIIDKNYAKKKESSFEKYFAQKENILQRNRPYNTKGKHGPMVFAFYDVKLKEMTTLQFLDQFVCSIGFF